MKNTVYISGPITGKKGYFGIFERAETLLTDAGFIALNPARLPEGMANEQYMRINFAMLDSADAVLFLDGWEMSRGASLECSYCMYIQKPFGCTIESIKDRLEHPVEVRTRLSILISQLSNTQLSELEELVRSLCGEGNEGSQ